MLDRFRPHHLAAQIIGHPYEFKSGTKEKLPGMENE